MSARDIDPSAPDGAEVTYTLVFPKMKGVLAAMVPVAFVMFGKPDIRKRMAELKTLVEASV